jgi:hypothetical protein
VLAACHAVRCSVACSANSLTRCAAQAGDELGGDVLGAAVGGEGNAEDAAILDMVTSTADDWQRCVQRLGRWRCLF